MTETRNSSGPEPGERRPAEQEAVRTTSVGGRPPGSGKAIGNIPRGVEVLVKKASVDPEFRELLLEKRAEAAKEIDLELEPAEAMMLKAVPREQLEVIIDRTTVERKHRRVFLGCVGAAMLAALAGTALVIAFRGEINNVFNSFGHTVQGIQPDRIEAPR